MTDWTIHQGCVLNVLPTLEAGSVHCCVTSPPYWGLRCYGTEGQLGLEPTPELFLERMVQVFREVRRVLRDDGTLWLNMGDSYAGGRSGQVGRPGETIEAQKPGGNCVGVWGLKPKDLCGIPWRLALALQADGWYLRADIIWCLSGGTRVYAKSQKGVMPMTVKDLARLKPGTVELWNGDKWTKFLGASRMEGDADRIELELRSGEKIGCTMDHKWPTERGVLRTSELQVGDCLIQKRLPDTEWASDCVDKATNSAWIAGLYLAEGSMSGSTMQFSLHADEHSHEERIRAFAHAFGGTCHSHRYGKSMTVCVEGRIPIAIVREFIAGRNAHDKHLRTGTWNRKNTFLDELLRGYLAGDGHWDAQNNRWRLGFCRNDALAGDLRTLCARLGYRLTLKQTFATCGGRKFPSHRGEVRRHQAGHENEQNRAEIVRIGRSRGRTFYDIGVEDEPHTFALASGVLTHNSKPNPMPESVTDRPTKAHEYVFLLTKQGRYYYDAEAVREESTKSLNATCGSKIYRDGKRMRNGINGTLGPGNPAGRNSRSVWNIPTQSFPEAHFATFPEELPRRCIAAGCPEGGTVLDPFAGSGTTVAVAARMGRRGVGIELNPEYVALAEKRIRQATRPATSRSDEVVEGLFA